MKIGICTMEAFDNRPIDSVGSSRIRAKWLLNYWPDAEVYKMGVEYDVMIFQKVYWDGMMENFKGIKILDICDPDWLEGRDVFKYVDLVDAVVTSTPALTEYMLKLRPNKKIICIPDRIYLPEHTMRTQKHSGTAKNAVWFGYHHNTHYLVKTFDELIEKNITLTIISNAAYQPPRAWEKLQVKNLPYSYPQVHEDIKMFDIALMPEPDDDLKGSFKSNNKSLTCWALGVPTAKDWRELETLMDGDVRQQKALDLRKEIEEKWDVKLSVEEYKILIEELKHKTGANSS